MKIFLQKRFKLAKNEKGMTLIELMAVVVILGILAGIAGVAVVNSFDKSKENADNTTAKIIQDAAQRYYMDKSEFTDSLATLRTSGYLNMDADPKPQQKDKSKFTIKQDATTKNISVTID